MRFNKFPWVNLLLSLLLLLSLVGCSAVRLNSSRTSVPGDASTLKTADPAVSQQTLAHFLSSASPLLSARFSNTPWGENVSLQAEAPYYAASGRYCRRLLVQADTGVSSRQLACDTGQGDWTAVRPVTELLGTAQAR